jgi:Zn-dependent M28 family amino/carboxypeptidase
MRTFVLCLCLFVASAAAHAQSTARLERASPAVDRIRSHVFNLADDSMAGRLAATAGYDKAARYVAEALNRFGVGPAFGNVGQVVSGYSHQFSFSLEPGGPEDYRSYNIVGLVPGTDENRRSQLIVVSAHLDHMGTHDGVVFNGASDNASGVAVVLEVARLVTKQPLRRTVLFAFFGAEELGKIGSTAFVELMSEDGAQIIANVNVDEVGHLSRGPAGRPLVRVLTGQHICPDLMNVVRVAGDSHGLAVSDRDPNEFFGRSDHYSFYQAGIPVLFFTGGWTHRWLHAPEDDAKRVGYGDLQRVASVVFETVTTLGNDQTLCEFMK